MAVAAESKMPKTLQLIMGQSFCCFKEPYSTQEQELIVAAKAKNKEPLCPDKLRMI